MKIFVDLEEILKIVTKEMKRRDISCIVGENPVIEFAEDSSAGNEIYGIDITTRPPVIPKVVI